MINKMDDLVIENKTILIKVARLIRELRQKSNLSQTELANRIGKQRHVVSDIEQGRLKTVNLIRLEKMVMACGAHLVITTTDPKKEVVLDTFQEDQVLLAFADGKIGEAERLLADLRRWQYPVTQVMARCKRDMGMTMSHYFKGLTDRSHSEMNQILMGLSLLGFVNEAHELKELYEHILDQSEGLLEGRKQK